MSEQELIDIARGGDERAYDRLVEPHRAELRAHCYRMLGSAHDAEDALQDALLRAWRGLDRFEGRSSLRSWLYRIATNACLRAIERRPKLVLPIDYGPAADPHDGPGLPLLESVWVEPYPDARLGLDDAIAGPEARYEQRESVELAFIAALQYLPGRQRAVLILRDVLGFSAREVADVLEMAPASVDSALQRAHKTVDRRLPQRSQQATLRALGDDGLREIVSGFMDAWDRADVEAVVAMLADDAAMTMPPMPTWYRGREAVAAFLEGWPLAGDRRWRAIPTRANGQLAFGQYIWDAERESFVAHGVNVLTLDGARIAEINSFLTPEAFERFGLPAEIGPDDGCGAGSLPTPPLGAPLDPEAGGATPLTAGEGNCRAHREGGEEGGLDDRGDPPFVRVLVARHAQRVRRDRRAGGTAGPVGGRELLVGQRGDRAGVLARGGNDVVLRVAGDAIELLRVLQVVLRVAVDDVALGRGRRLSRAVIELGVRGGGNDEAQRAERGCKAAGGEHGDLLGLESRAACGLRP
jgi:RNA polymerase sigma-70 factor (ECF subfamily)